MANSPVGERMEIELSNDSNLCSLFQSSEDAAPPPRDTSAPPPPQRDTSAAAGLGLASTSTPCPPVSGPCSSAPLAGTSVGASSTPGLPGFVSLDALSVSLMGHMQGHMEVLLRNILRGGPCRDPSGQVPSTPLPSNVLASGVPPPVETERAQEVQPCSVDQFGLPDVPSTPVQRSLALKRPFDELPDELFSSPARSSDPSSSLGEASPAPVQPRPPSVKRRRPPAPSAEGAPEEDPRPSLAGDLDVSVMSGQTSRAEDLLYREKVTLVRTRLAHLLPPEPQELTAPSVEPLSCGTPEPHTSDHQGFPLSPVVRQAFQCRYVEAVKARNSLVRRPQLSRLYTPTHRDFLEAPSLPAKETLCHMSAPQSISVPMKDFLDLQRSLRATTLIDSSQDWLIAGVRNILDALLVSLREQVQRMLNSKRDSLNTLGALLDILKAP